VWCPCTVMDGRKENTVLDRNDIQEFAQKLAAALGPVWTYVPPPESGGFWATLTSGDWKLNLDGTKQDGKIHISGTHNTPPEEYEEWRQVPCGTDSIGRSIDRDPAVIARDVVRTILPTLEISIARAKEEIRETRLRKAAVASAVSRIIGAAPGKGWYVYGSDDHKISVNNVQGHGEIRVDYGAATAAIDLYSIPMNKAVRIAAILSEG